MLLAAYLLPWFTGAIWLIWLDSFASGERSSDVLQAQSINWPKSLGYGFFLGNFICASALYLVHAYTGRLSVPLAASILIVLSALGVLLIWHRSSHITLSSVPRAQFFARGSQWLMLLLLGLVLVHLALALLDVLSRPVLPWDAWTTWTYRAKIWFLNQDLSLMVSPESWLGSKDPGTYSSHAYTYPLIVSLIQLWPVQVYGYWSDSLAILPGMLAGIALAMGLYGQGKSLNWSPLVMLAAAYMLLSVPLLDAHLALPGYADLWLGGYAGLGFVALLQWTRSGDKSQLLLGLLLMLFGVLIKREGSIWMLAGMLFVFIRLLPWQLLLAVGFGLLLAVFSGHSLLQLPLLGQLGYSDGILYLAQLGVYPIQVHNISSAVATNLFFHASWNLVHFYLLAVLGLIFLPACRSIRWTLLWFILLISGVIGGIFFLSDEGRWAQDNTALNRIILQMLPALMFSLLMVWHALFPTEKSAQSGSET